MTVMCVSRHEQSRKNLLSLVTRKKQLQATNHQIYTICVDLVIKIPCELSLDISSCFFYLENYVVGLQLRHFLISLLH